MKDLLLNKYLATPATTKCFKFFRILKCPTTLRYVLRVLYPDLTPQSNVVQTACWMIEIFWHDHSFSSRYRFIDTTSLYHHYHFVKGSYEDAPGNIYAPRHALSRVALLHFRIHTNGKKKRG